MGNEKKKRGEYLLKSRDNVKKKEHITHYRFSNADLRKLLIPLLIEQFLAMAVGLADSIMVASVGEAAVSAVSLVDTIFVLLINVFAALATGGAVIAGQYIGKKRPEQGCRATDQLLVFTTVFSILIMALTYLGKNFILTSVFGKIEPDVRKNCEIYLLIVAASIPFIAIYNAGAAIFRAMGNSKIPMYLSILMNGINICGNALLLYGLKYGIEGAAIPTLISRVIAAIGITVLLRNQKLLLHLSKPFNFHLEWKMLKKILYIGIPNGLENSMFQLGKILVLSMVAGFGTASIAANAVGNSIAMFQILPGVALNFGLLTVTSQCIGAGEFEQVRYYTKKLMLAIHGLMLIANVLVLLALPLILKTYRLSAEASEIAKQLIWYHAICTVTIWPSSFSLPNTLRAAADVNYCMWISILSMWIFRIGMSYIIGVRMEMGVLGIWIAMTIDWVVRAILFQIRYRRGKWALEKQL